MPAVLLRRTGGGIDDPRVQELAAVSEAWDFVSLNEPQELRIQQCCWLLSVDAATTATLTAASKKKQKQYADWVLTQTAMDDWLFDESVTPRSVLPGLQAAFSVYAAVGTEQEDQSPLFQTEPVPDKEPLAAPRLSRAQFGRAVRTVGGSLTAEQLRSEWESRCPLNLTRESVASFFGGRGPVDEDAADLDPKIEAPLKTSFRQLDPEKTGKVVRHELTTLLPPDFAASQDELWLLLLDNEELITWRELRDLAKAAAERGMLEDDFIRCVVSLQPELPCRLDKSIENLKRMHSLLTGEDGVMTLESLIAGCELVGIDHAKDQSSWFKGNRLQVELDRSGGGTGGAADLVTMALQKPADITRDLVTQLRKFVEIFALLEAEAGEGQPVKADALLSMVTHLFGWRPTRYEGDKMIEAVDTDGSGEIELDEFVAMMQTIKSESLGTIKTQLNQLHDLFMMFDLGQGSSRSIACFEFGLTEFSLLMRCTGAPHSDQLLELAFSKLDPDGDNSVSFAEFGTFMQIEKDSELAGMVRLQHIELCSFFGLLDEDKGGSIDFTEAAQLLQLIGREPSEKEIDELCVAIGAHSDEEVNFEGFVRLMANGKSSIQEKLLAEMKRLRESFKIFDDDGGGTVGYDEFVECMDTVFGYGNAREALKVVRGLDTRGVGFIDFANFVALMAFEPSAIQKLLHTELRGYLQVYALFAEEDTGGLIPLQTLAFQWLILGLGAAPDVVNRLSAFGFDGSFELGFADFVRVLGKGALTSIAELTDMWALFDRDGDGSISMDEASGVLSSLGLTIDLGNGTAKAMMELAGVSLAGGELSFQHFVTIISHSKANQKARVERQKGHSTENLLKRSRSKLGLDFAEDDSHSELLWVREQLWAAQVSGKDLRTDAGVVKQNKLTRARSGRQSLLVRKGSAVMGLMGEAHAAPRRSRRASICRRDSIVADFAQASSNGEQDAYQQIEQIWQEMACAVTSEDREEWLKELERTEDRMRSKAKPLMAWLVSRIQQKEEFEAMPVKVLLEVVTMAKLVYWYPGAHIVREGKASNLWFMMLRGTALVYKRRTRRASIVPVMVRQEKGMPVAKAHICTPMVATWRTVRVATLAAVTAITAAIEVFPNAKNAASASAGMMVTTMGEVEEQASAWIKEAKLYLNDDMLDVWVQEPWLAKKAKDHISCMRSLHELCRCRVKEIKLVVCCSEHSLEARESALLVEFRARLSALLELLKVLTLSLKVLEPMFHPESVVGSKLCTEAESSAELGSAMSTLTSPQGYGEVIFNQGGREINNPVSVVAHRTDGGVTALTISRKVLVYCQQVESLAALRTVPGLAGIALESMIKLCVNSTRRELKFGQVLATQGSKCESIYVVRTGQLNLSVDVNGELGSQVVAIVGAGDILNDYVKTQRGDGVYGHNATACSECIVYEISRVFLESITTSTNSQSVLSQLGTQVPARGQARQERKERNQRIQKEKDKIMEAGLVDVASVRSQVRAASKRLELSKEMNAEVMKSSAPSLNLQAKQLAHRLAVLENIESPLRMMAHNRRLNAHQHFRQKRVAHMTAAPQSATTRMVPDRNVLAVFKKQYATVPPVSTAMWANRTQVQSQIGGERRLHQSPVRMKGARHNRRRAAMRGLTPLARQLLVGEQSALNEKTFEACGCRNVLEHSVRCPPNPCRGS